MDRWTERQMDRKTDRQIDRGIYGYIYIDLWKREYNVY